MLEPRIGVRPLHVPVCPPISKLEMWNNWVHSGLVRGKLFFLRPFFLGKFFQCCLALALLQNHGTARKIIVCNSESSSFKLLKIRYWQKSGSRATHLSCSNQTPDIFLGTFLSVADSRFSTSMNLIHSEIQKYSKNWQSSEAYPSCRLMTTQFTCEPRFPPDKMFIQIQLLERCTDWSWAPRLQFPRLRIAPKVVLLFFSQSWPLFFVFRDHTQKVLAGFIWQNISLCEFLISSSYFVKPTLSDPAIVLGFASFSFWPRAGIRPWHERTYRTAKFDSRSFSQNLGWLRTAKSWHFTKQSDASIPISEKQSCPCFRLDFILLDKRSLRLTTCNVGLCLGISVLESLLWVRFRDHFHFVKITKSQSVLPVLRHMSALFDDDIHTSRLLSLCLCFFTLVHKAT